MPQLTRVKGLLSFYICVIGLTIFGIFLGSRTVSVIAQSKPLYRSHCVIIDPGHGGMDGGAVSCTGTPESEFNLSISMRLNDMLQLLGYDTFMIRREDISVNKVRGTISQMKISDLKERVRMINGKEGETVLLSIHQNYFTDGKYSGAQVFYGSWQKSKEFALRMQDAIVRYLNPGSRRMAKKGEGIYVLENSKCPAILIECGFLSNSEEERMLHTQEYQKRLITLFSAITASQLNAS